MRLHRSPTCTGILALLTLLLSSCSSSETPALSPKIELTDIRLDRIRLAQQSFSLSMRIQNPNYTSLSIQTINYQLQINGISLPPQQAYIGRTLLPNASIDIDVPLQTSLWQQVQPLVKTLKKDSGTLRYTLNAEIKTDSFWSNTLYARKQGEIDLDIPYPR